MTIHARQACFVQLPHHPGWVLDDDDAILAAYRSSERRISTDRALWEARSGRRCSCWTIWDGDTCTGQIVGRQDEAEARVLQLIAGRHAAR